MRKILTVIYITLSALVLFVAVSIWTVISPNEFLYGNTTTISISADSAILSGTVAEHLTQISKEYDVTLSKQIWSNSNTVSVFSTDPSMGGAVKLLQGNLPQTDKTTFAANTDTGSALQTGTFRLFSPETSVLLYPFHGLDSRGYLGLCELHTQDEQLVAEILDYLNTDVGATTVYDVYSGDVVGTIFEWLLNVPFLLGFLLLTLMLLLFALMRYSIHESRTVVILELNGFGKCRILLFHARVLLPCCLCSLLLNLVAVAMALTILGGAFLLPAFVAVAIFTNLLLYLGSLFVLLIVSSVQSKVYSKVSLLNGKRPFAFLTSLQWILKYAVLMVLLFGMVQATDTLTVLNGQYTANSVWKQAENVYRVKTKFVTDDPAAERQLQHMAASVYRNMEAEGGLMLMDASNYAEMGDKLLWEINTANKDSIYSGYGPCITVNENYLSTHPVKTASGENVLELLIREETTQNILVPVSLKEYENEIRSNFQSDFYFQKAEVQNSIYADTLGEAQSPYSLQDLKINIIYVVDGAAYFTYDAFLASHQQNQILDPIVVVDGHNIDDSFYYSYMTRCCYFMTESQNPTESLFAAASLYDASNLYASVAPVYDERADTLKTLEQSLGMTLLAAAFLAVGALLSIYLFCTCWYVQHQYEIMVKRVHGYGMLKICGRMLFFNVGFTAVLAIVFPGTLLLPIRILLPLVDFVTTLLCCAVMNGKAIQTALKGEN